jgi:hypothetical protein
VLCKVDQRRGLAITSRRGDECQLARQTTLHSLIQPRSVQEASRARYKQLGTDKGQFGNNHRFVGSKRSFAPLPTVVYLTNSVGTSGRLHIQAKRCIIPTIR